MKRAIRKAIPSIRAMALAAAVSVATSTGVCVASSHGSHDEPEAVPVPLSDSPIQGIELGQYRVRSYYPVEAQKSTVTFALYAAAPTEKFSATHEFVDSHEHKIRDQVIIATRLAPLAEFDQPDLTAFRRRILTRLRRSLPELEITDIYVSDFVLLVKSL